MRYQPLALLLVLFAVGCASKDAINVAVKNDTDGPLTIRLIKDKDNWEYFWASPEDQENARVVVMPGRDPGGWADNVPAGKTFSKSNLTGNFKPGEHPVLRVYEGKDLPMKDLLNMTPERGYRVDAPLMIGDNVFVVHSKDGKLSIEAIPQPVAH